MNYLLDTNICIYLIRHKPTQILKQFSAIKPEDVFVSAVTVAELQYGVAKSQQPVQNADALDQFLLPLNVLEFDRGSAWHYGRLRAELERGRQVIGSLDMLITAQALWLEAILVTNNERAFDRVPGLQVENWVV